MYLDIEDACHELILEMHHPFRSSVVSLELEKKIVLLKTFFHLSMRSHISPVDLEFPM